MTISESSASKITGLEAFMGLFLISIAYQTIVNRRLDLVRACPDHLKVYQYQVDLFNKLLLLGDLGDLGKSAPNPIV